MTTLAEVSDSLERIQGWLARLQAGDLAARDELLGAAVCANRCHQGEQAVSAKECA